MQINPSTHREELLHDVVLVHIQAQESNPMLLARCRMQCHAHGQVHLTRRRRGCDDDQIRPLPSSDEGIEILHTRGNASHLASLCMGSLMLSRWFFPSDLSPPSCPPRPSTAETMSCKRLPTTFTSLYYTGRLLNDYHDGCSRDFLLSSNHTHGVRRTEQRDLP